MKWSKSDINHIKVSLNRCDAQGLASELGAAKKVVEKKIQEIKARERLSSLSEYVKNKSIR